MLYFAYGSNLCPLERERWLAQHGLTGADLRPVGAALLPDHELSFGYWSVRREGGALDVRACRGSVVHGALFAVSDEGWRMLDLKEGVADPVRGYRRVRRQAVLPDGKLIDVVTYEVKPSDRRAHCEPAAGYVETVVSGLRHWQLRPEAHDALQAAAEGRTGAALIHQMLVYGTLMRGELRWPAMARAGLRQVLLGRSRATLHPAAEDPPGQPFPAITLDAPCHELQGDLVESADILALLEEADAIESFYGHGDARNAYHRTVLPVDIGQPEALPRLAWAYVAAPLLPLGEPHATGCWREARGRRQGFLQQLVQAHGVAGSPLLEGRSLEALVQALDTGELSEWALARASGRWTVLTEADPQQRFAPARVPEA